MSHNATPSEIGLGVGVLTIGATRRPGQQQPEARITKVGVSHKPKGIRVKLRSTSGEEGLGIDIVGEDLYALREFLSELPEEAFVRPADPVEKPPRWTDNDVVEETTSRGFIYIWVRRNGVWLRVDDLNRHTSVTDDVIEASLSGKHPINRVKVIRQASGQDL